jgi:predicted Zn-dependent peptidase
MGRIEDLEATTAQIDAVTPEDITRVAKRLFSQSIQLAAIGPFRSEAPFLRQIA